MPKKRTPTKTEPTFDEIGECLGRSGYLMESRIVRSLVNNGYFVEPNQVFCDPRTGKSREIDLVAEYYGFDRNPDHRGLCVKSIFVVEAINNRLPFVLLTERPSTPNANFESYIKLIYTPEPNQFIESIDLYELKKADWEDLFSQYCVLTTKKGNDELMAWHPDDVYAGFLKMSEYVEREMQAWNTRENRNSAKYTRIFFWQPMLVLGGQLITVSMNHDGTPYYNRAQFGRLEFNWHAGDLPQTTVIEVVTEDFFLERLATVVAKDEKVEELLHAMRNRQLPATKRKREL